MDRSEEEEQLPPGFRFHPTDEELITYYLRNKIIEASFDARAIAEVDLNKCEPWDLPGKARMGEKEWYFFSLRDRKYPTGVRTNRATNAGYWKTTGKDKEIFDNSISAELVGTKKTLVFYKGRAPRGEKTNWIMHEYRLHSKSPFKGNKEEWVVCRVFMKSCGYKKCPSNQHRADSFHLEMAPPIMPSLLQNDLINCHFGVGRNYLANGELMELSKLAPRGTHGFKLPIQLNYSGSFTPPSGAPPPTVLHATPVPLSQPQVPSSSLPTNCIVGGFSPDANSMVTGARYRNMDSCVEIEGYWSPY